MVLDTQPSLPLILCSWNAAGPEGDAGWVILRLRQEQLSHSHVQAHPVTDVRHGLIQDNAGRV